jgi:eukaryotic-like serine/threonine-protein kinase
VEPSSRSTTRQRRVIGPTAVLGGYEIETRLGVGGMAEVYAAKRSGPHGFSKRVAIKRVLPSAAEDEDFLRMFIHEAELAASLSHPNIVQVFDFGDDEGELYLAMELVEGTTLARVMRTLAARDEALPLPLVLYLMSQTARALDYAHRLRDSRGEPLRLVHRDVSPGNVLLTRTGHLKLADFGIACTVVSERHTGAQDLRGKLGYMSPEQVLGHALDGKSDVFTLATIFAELLISAPLFSGGSQLDVLLRIRDVNLRALDDSKRKVPADVRKLLLDALRADPQLRPDARTFAERIDAISARRGYPADASGAVSQLMARYELCSLHEDDVQRESGDRPTSLLGDTELTSPTFEAGVPGLVSEIDLSQRRTYVIDLPERGTRPCEFPELMRLTATGKIDAQTIVRRDRDVPRAAAELPELSRVFATPALQWDKTELEAPTFRGQLSSGSLLPIVHRLMHGRETGVLHLDDGRHRKKVYFSEGRPDFVASTQPEDMLGQYLVDKKVCMPMEVDMGLAVLPQHKGRLGDALVSLGVLRPVELYRAVAGQVRGRYLDAFALRRGEFVYVRDRRSREDTYPIEQDVHVLMRDACLALHPSELEAALAPLWERVLRPAQRPDGSISAYQVPDSWRWVAEQVRGDQTVAALLARCSQQSGLDIEDAMRALFLCVSCRLFEAA